MFFADNYEQYKYTMIIVPIKLKKSPSDYDDMRYYWDIDCEEYLQENVYIGIHKISEIRLSRLKKANFEYESEAEWNLKMVILGGKSEEETIGILNELCALFSLNYICKYKHFQHCGFDGFAYDKSHIERKYANEDKVFSESAFNMYCGQVEVGVSSRIENKVFNLPKRTPVKNELKNKLVNAFLRALKCKDEISRYILLYYLFEIIYESDQYKKIKKQYELANPQNSVSKSKCDKNASNEKRSKILFQYLQQELNINKYFSLGKDILLNEKILEVIIKTRNDLSHRGDTSKVSQLMYNHLIPILQEVIRKIRK